MTVGKYSYNTPPINVLYGSMEQVTIGNFCSIGKGLTIYLGGNHRPDWGTTYPFGLVCTDTFPVMPTPGHPSTNGDVTIGNDVWIGNDVTIMSGIAIGDGAVIACNSHVVSSVQPYSITGGNPARHIKLRFDEEITEGILQLKWWDWDVEKINLAIPLLCQPMTKEVLKLLRGL